MSTSLRLAGLAAVVALPLAAHAAEFDGETIRVQFWGGSDGLVIRKYIVEPFEQATGAHVVVEEGNTSASIAKVRAQKDDPQLDVIFLDDIGVLTLEREDVLEKLDLSKLPHADQIPELYHVGDGTGIGIFNYITTILYNPEKVEAPTSWNDLWNEEFRDQILSPKITDTQGLLFTVMAARLNGGGIDDIEAAWPKLEEFRPNVYAFIENRALDAEALKSGEAVMAVDIPYYFKPYIERDYPIAMTTDLEEGYFSITGTAAIVKGSEGNRDVAYAFIDRALTPVAQAGLGNELWYGPTNPNTELSPEVEKYMVHTQEQFKNAIQVDRLKLLDMRQDIINKWNEIMTR